MKGWLQTVAHSPPAAGSFHVSKNTEKLPRATVVGHRERRVLGEPRGPPRAALLPGRRQRGARVGGRKAPQPPGPRTPTGLRHGREGPGFKYAKGRLTCCKLVTGCACVQYKNEKTSTVPKWVSPRARRRTAERALTKSEELVGPLGGLHPPVSPCPGFRGARRLPAGSGAGAAPACTGCFPHVRTR